MSTQQYIPFQKRYTKYRLLNYGKPYTDYTKYTLKPNPDNVEFIYIDNNPCIEITLQHNIENEQLPFYVEIHYNCGNIFENIFKNHELDTLIQKYICIL